MRNRYVIHRLLALIPTTLGVLLLTFLIFHVIGGSPAEVVLGKNASPATLADFDSKHGYDLPLLFGNWTSTRALPDGAAAAPPPASRWDAPLAFPLPEGRYRLAVRPAAPPAAEPILRVRVRPAGADADTDAPAIAARPEGNRFFFEVPAGHRAEAAWIEGGAPPLAWKLRRRVRHFFDSQFVHYLASVLRGDLGESTEHGAPVLEVLKDGVGPSLALTVPILLFGTMVAVGLGLAAALWRDGAVDRSILLASTALMSINYVVWVVAGQYLLAFRLRLFPIWGFENWTFLLLPVLVGVVSGLGRDVRFFRTVFLDELHRPYVRTAVAKGLPPARILFAHVLRNSLIPLLTYVSLSIPFLFTGSVLLESFFGIPGLGCVSLNAIHSSDMAVVRAVVILGALLYQIVNLLTDLAYAWLDPRVRIGP
ncbi:MAG: ABC transporter permease [Kiritimatiellia bacterium]|jgi:peptide/nickel transport system permease protein